MPPDSSWGYWLRRCLGADIRTRSSSSQAFSIAFFGVSPRCAIRVSEICSPMVNTGFSEVMGSWKIMPIPLPRTCCICAALRRNKSWPSNSTSPLAIFPGGVAISRMIESAVTDLPQPDSPTSAKISERPMLKDTPSTAFNRPLDVWNCVQSSLTSSTGLVSESVNESVNGSYIWSARVSGVWFISDFSGVD